MLARCVVNRTGLGAVALAGVRKGLRREARTADIPGQGQLFLAVRTRAVYATWFTRCRNPADSASTSRLISEARPASAPTSSGCDSIDYAVNAARSAGFYAQIRKYWPALADGQLSPAYSGVRPKIAGPGEPAADFRIDGPETHGVAGLVNLFGIESPGLTASLAIAKRVAGIVGPE